jgi:UDP-N-acetylglucosamine--N-acetylmuramyl-(pentapeptide) pyrophosphoryl-undecaprenol N-acetylglucosamine transferase
MTTLLVTSVGGHLTQLHRLVPRLQGIDQDRLWVTFDSPQSRSMLENEDVLYLDYAGPRDIRSVVRHALVARRLFRGSHPFSTVVSAGSGIALSFLPLGLMRGASCHYIESAARSAGPSLTGRLLRRVPGIELYTQYPIWARPPWNYAGSVFDTFVSGPQRQHDGVIRRAVVTVGTMEDYSFRRLIERALAVLPRDAEVLWQVGCTDVADLPIDARRQLPASELQRAITEADVVIAHTGCGSSVAALEAGKKPVLVPRRQAYGENVDDHQLFTAEELQKRDLAVVRGVEDLSLADLRLAACSTISTSSGPLPFVLAE